MPIVYLSTEIQQSKQVVFDLARSIDLHKFASGNTKEKAIAGCTSGLINLHETVTWEAVHFGIKQQLTSKITEFNLYNSFTDEMVCGAFKSFTHKHLFKEVNGKTTMEDLFHFTSPFGILGKLANSIFLSKYLHSFLNDRNQVIKNIAESNQWKEFLQFV